MKDDSGIPKEMYIVMRVGWFGKPSVAVAICETKDEYHNQICGRTPWRKTWLKKARFYPKARN